MDVNISLIEKKAKRLFLNHRKTSYTIGLFFICCCLYVDFVTISNTCHKIDNLEYKEGVVSYWDHEVKNEKEGIPYYGLCEKGNPRTSFWLFFDVLFPCYKPILIWWALGIIGIILFNFQIIRDRYVLPLSIVVLGVSFLMFIIASIS